MRTLTVFEQVSLDGFFATPTGDMSWAHRSHDLEHREFVEANALSGGELLFGRITYEQMASFWPTPVAAQMMPIVAEQMNAMPKYVASTTLRDPQWANTRVLSGDLVAAVRALKATAGPSIAILGSGTIVEQLASAGLIDQYQVLTLPIVLGGGRTMFGAATLDLRLASTRSFKNGNVYAVYEPAP